MADVTSIYLSPPTLKPAKPERSGTMSESKLLMENGSTLKLDSSKQIMSIMDLGRSLLEAAREGNTDAVSKFIAQGAPFTTDWLGTSPLHLAAKHNHLETCRVLLRSGLNKDCKTKVERTPLHLAVFESNVDVTELLLKHKCNPNALDMLKMSPLHWAVEKESEKTVELLMQHGANPNLKSKFGKTPISMAAERKLTSILRKLLKSDVRKDPEPAALKTEELDIEDIIEEEVADPEEEEETEDVFVNFSPSADPSTAKTAGIELLREHGIHIMKDDDDHSVIKSALDSGRKLILSEAGKFVLRNSLDTDVFPTTSSKPPWRSKSAIVRQGSSKKFFHMSANEYKQLFKRSSRTQLNPVLPPPKVAKVEEVPKLPQETTITVQQETTAPVTVAELDKQVQELRKECQDLRKKLDISQRQNQEYQRRLEKLESVLLVHRPSS